MSARAEHQLAVVVAERFVVFRSRDGVGRGLLFGEGHVVVHAVAFFIFADEAADVLLEQRAVFFRHGEVHVGLPLLVGGVEGGFHQVFLHRGAFFTGAGVEQQQPFGQRTVVQTFAEQQVGHDGFVLPPGFQRGDALAFVALAGLVEGRVECEFIYFVKEFLHERVGRSVVRTVQKFEQVLEHAAGRSRCGDELHHRHVAMQVVVPGLLVDLQVVGGHLHDAVAHFGGTVYLEERETGAERAKLFFHLSLGYALGLQGLFVLCL